MFFSLPTFNVKGIAYAILSSATFGLIPLLALPVVAAGMDKPSILFYRFCISAFLMGIIVWMKGANFRISLSQLVSLLSLGFFYAATSLLLMDAYTLIPSGAATTIHFLYPVMVSAIMIFFFKEQKSAALLFAALLSLGGVATLSWSPEHAFNVRGVIASVASVLTYALYIVGVQKSKIRYMNEYTLTFYVLLSSSVFFLFNVVFTTGFQPIPDLSSGISIFLLALLPTVISDLSLVLAIKYIGSTTTSVLGSMEPLTAVAIGVLVFNEPFGMRVMAGVFFILTAVILIILTQKRTSVQVEAQNPNTAR
ncbi:MAG: DMT family transporter [Bacteroidales bacterium]